MRPICVLSAALFISTTSFAQVASQLDISSCFNGLLQKQVDYRSDTRLALATLSQINSTNYEVMKHDASLAGQYGILSGSANYSDFNDKRSTYFQQNQLSLQYYQSISLSTRTLDTEAYGTINKCIDTVAASTYGFRYLYLINNRTDAAIQFFWQGTPGSPPTIDIVDSYLDNANAKNTGAGDSKLYPYVSRLQLFTPYPTIGLSSPVIILTRKDPDKDIRISLTTRPPVSTGFITIPKVPAPTKEPICKTVFDRENPATKTPYILTQTFNTNNYIGDRHGCSDCAGFVVGFNTPGLIWQIDKTTEDHVWVDFCSGEGTTHAQCSGYQNANPKNITMTAHYQMPRQVCTYP
jgi:hypothetical protein